MAKKKKGARIYVKLECVDDQGRKHFYVKQKNVRNTTTKLELMLYHPYARKHLLYKETKKKL